jgi:hypothetical protein
MQQSRYKIRLYRPGDGAMVAEFDNWRTLNITNTVNSVGNHTISLEGLTGAKPDSRFDLFTLDSIVEVWRRPFGKEWYMEYGGFHRTPQIELSEGGHYIFTSYGVSSMDLIKRRRLLYPSTLAQSIKGNPGETVIKEFVNENAGPGANNPLRKNNGVTRGLSIEADLGRGLTWFGQRSWQPLLDIVNEVGLASGVDFTVVRTGPGTFEFRCYYPQMGTDRRTTAIFSPQHANMLAPSYTISRTEEATVCVVLGQEEGTARRTVTRRSVNESDSPWNMIEMTRDARNEATYLGMVQDGDEALAEVVANPEFKFRVLQTEGLRYGVDYFLGDMITAKLYNITEPKKIVEIAISVSEGKEDIDVGFAEIPSFYNPR